MDVELQGQKFLQKRKRDDVDLKLADKNKIR